jgi:pimeloyl-[acyl-carrier protein] methyl ester esterase
VKPRLLLRHGWAFDHTMWRGVLQVLGKDGWGAIALDAGYYGPPFNAPEIDGPVLGVGHSLGSLEFLADPPPRLAGVVAINGFARFSRAKDFPEGVPERVLIRMSRDVMDGSLEGFFDETGGTPPEGIIDAERLRQGLDRLRTWDGRDNTSLPIWRLHSENDGIASLALSDASFAGMKVVERRVRPTAHHLSPLDDAEACADLIRTALKALS